MVTPTNHVIARPNSHRAEPLALGDFCNIFLPSIGENPKKSSDLSAGPIAGTASYYGKSSPG